MLLMEEEPFDHDTLRIHQSQRALTQLIAEAAPGDGEFEAAEGLFLKKRSKPHELFHNIYEPSLSLVAQGQKEVRVGHELYTYGPARYLINSADLPVTSQVTEASSQRPYLGLRLVLDPDLVGSVLLEADLPAKKGAADVRAIDVGRLEADLLEAVVRLVRLLKTPEHTRMLTAPTIREIIYWLLIGKQGMRLRHIAMLEGGSHRITEAISRLRQDFDQPLRVESIAREVGMSTASFHHHFKAVTSVSPLQFQKQLRLFEARRLMLIKDIDAASAGFRVGYNDASHFSREYRRFFGSPPMQDVQRLRKDQPTTSN